LAQTTYDTIESCELAALKQLLSTLKLEGDLIQPDALHSKHLLFRPHRYTDRISATVPAYLRIMVMNLLPRAGYLFIFQGNWVPRSSWHQ